MQKKADKSEDGSEMKTEEKPKAELPAWAQKLKRYN
jgi:serine/threonine-protein phosphatase 2A regulatory subunit B''